MQKKTVIALILSLIIMLFVGAVAFYITLPALNLRDTGFYPYLTLVLLSFVIPFTYMTGTLRLPKSVGKNGKKAFAHAQGKFPLLLFALALSPIAVLILGNVISSTFFNAKAYANVITVEEALFEEDMPETDNVTNIALMDSETASVIGNRTLGSLAEVVSQYGIGANYSQINYRNTPKKVATLEYLGFFQWMNNLDAGIPGYVLVDPVENTAEYVEFETSIRYTESGYFADDLMRALRFRYPTKIFGSCAFEIDENGNPHYIVSCMKPRVMLFGAYDVEEVIIFDPTNGDSELCSLAETPAWVDTVFTGDHACEKYDWHGTLSGGFFNSIIGNRGCKITTDDFGYLVRDDDVWYFTGVTSITEDASNIGFLLSNARTGEYKFYPVVGAEEHSAMGAAEGEVQEKGYKASFPSLVNISGEATYIMVLKDSNSIVKLYALVNVENYRLVATGKTQAETMAAYRNLLRENGIDLPNTPSEDAERVTFTVADVRIVTLDGEATVYLTAENGDVYKGSLLLDESLILIRKGDRITVLPEQTEIDRIYRISSWESAGN